jgi:hypothetical protein
MGLFPCVVARAQHPSQLSSTKQNKMPLSMCGHQSSTVEVRNPAAHWPACQDGAGVHRRSRGPAATPPQRQQHPADPATISAPRTSPPRCQPPSHQCPAREAAEHLVSQPTRSDKSAKPSRSPPADRPGGRAEPDSVPDACPADYRSLHRGCAPRHHLTDGTRVDGVHFT